VSVDAPRVGVATAVGVAFAVQTGVALVIFAPPVLAPAATRTMGLDPSTVGVFTSIVYLFAAIAAVSSARPVAALGTLRASQVCLLLCAAGIALVGPSAAALRTFGDKTAARALAKKIGVSMVPGRVGSMNGPLSCP